jgi:hypothetical protein
MPFENIEALLSERVSALKSQHESYKQIRSKLDMLLEKEHVLRNSKQFLGNSTQFRNIEESRFSHNLGVIDSVDINQ